MQRGQHLAVLAYGLSDGVFTHHWEGAQLLGNKICGKLLPWLDTGPEDPREIAERMERSYIDAFGDPRDPEYAAEIDKLIAHWEGKDAA